MRLHANTNWALQIAPVIDQATMTLWAWRYKLKRAKDALAKLHRGASPPVPARGLGRFDIREIDRCAASDFAMVVERGFPVPPHVGQWLSALVGRPHWKTYLAYDGDVPIGCAAMFVRDGWAWLGAAATLSAYWGRGTQKALIARRIGDGVAAGVAGFTVETGKPYPGQESDHPSYRNLLGAGFRMAYARAQYVSFR